MATPRPASSSRRRQPSPSPDREPDVNIGEFRRGKEIGKGSFANVYLAQHRNKKSFAAVKVIQMGRLSSRLKLNLESEIAILKDIKHPHVVALFDCIDTPTYFYMIMEYCPLSDLSQFLKKRQTLATLPETSDIFRKYPNPPVGGFHEVLSRHFIKQIASALGYLRSRNLMHRDLKPQNLLLNPSPAFMATKRPEDMPLAASENSLTPQIGLASLPMLKIADFGFARHLPSTSMAETLCGSPLYMAPEILRYEKYDAKADLWSAGGVLYEMVVGKPPFRAQNHVELLRRIEKANDQIIFDNKNMTISRGMKDLIRKLLKKNPLDRVSYEEFFADPVVTSLIPGVAEEDSQKSRTGMNPRADASDLSRPMTSQATQATVPVVLPPEEVSSSARRSLDTSRKPDDQEMSPLDGKDRRRKSSSGGENAYEGSSKDTGRTPGLREQPKQRRPSLVPHITAPARQELVGGSGAGAASSPRMERRHSRTSPLAGPPMVRESSTAESPHVRDDRAMREARERTAQDVAFEKEYVVIEKRAVEINAFADELDANRGSPQNGGAMVRRATTQGQPGPVAGTQPTSPSRAMQMVAGRPQVTHQRAGSFERRYAPSQQSATNMLAKVVREANVRLFGALGTSPPFGKGPSPPRGYGAFPTYPSPQNVLLLGEGGEAKAPMDEDTKIVRTMEDAAHRSDVIFGFAEVKYRQLLPATPSTQDALGIQQLGGRDKVVSGPGEEEDRDMTTVAIVGVAEEALVLYVKTLAILAKTIDLAGCWWSKQSKVELAIPDVASRANGSPMPEIGKRMNNVVQWARNRFNECLGKCEVVGRKLQAAQRQLPEDHPGHPNNQAFAATGSAGAITASAEQIHITSGITAQKLMFERAVEMSRAAAVSELVGEDLGDCEIGYVTAIMLLEAVLESDDEPLMRKPSAKKDRPADETINGMETEDRQTVIKLIEGARSRLHSLRKKLHIAQQAARKPSHGGSGGNVTPKPSSNISPAVTPTASGSSP